MRRRVAAIVTTLVGISVVASPAALGGTISGTAFMDYDSNGTRNDGGFTPATSVTATDSGVAGVTVTAYDASGAQVAVTTTAADGTYSLTTPGSASVRVQFTPPAGYEPSFRGTSNGTGVQFVDGSGSGIDFAVTKASQYCQDNPTLVTCMQQATGMAGEPSFATRPGAFTVPSTFYVAQSISAQGRIGTYYPYNNVPPDSEIIAPFPEIGAAFGVGADRQGNAYYGTYVKRHSPYGAAGAVNAIYQVNVAGKTSSTFTTLGSATLPAHVSTAPAGWPPYSQDGRRNLNPGDPGYTDVYSKVGRAGIGDVDVAPDEAALYAVEMTQGAPKLWRVALEGAGANVAAGAKTSWSISAPGTFNGVECRGQWHPMGMGISDGDFLVGGTCGAETNPPVNLTNWSIASGVLTITTGTAHNLSVGDTVAITGDGFSPWPDASVYSSPITVASTPTGTTFTAATAVAGSSSGVGFSPGGGGSPGAKVVPLTAAVFVLRFDRTNGTFSTVLAQTLDYPKGGNNNNLTTWRNPYTQGSGLWRPWDDSWTFSPGQNQPMLGNIEIMGNGDLVLAMRDRVNDQMKYKSVSYEWSGTGAVLEETNPISAGDMLRMCKQGSGWVMEYNGACGATQGAAFVDLLSSGAGSPSPSSLRPSSPLYYNTVLSQTWDGTGDGHAFTSLGGAATIPGAPFVWTTTMDANDYSTQGLRVYGPCPDRATNMGNCGPRNVADGAILGTVQLGWGSYSNDSSFSKGNGLGDLEVMCDAAPVQVGNRVWIDTNANGVQDPGEAAVAGATVRLYDSLGTMVGTAVTGSDGTYYFSSNSTTPAAGDGTNAGGGLRPGEAFTLKMDNPADYAAGGPLAPYGLTTANSSSPGNAANSKATLQSGYPTVSIPARSAGQNNHTFDIGFVSSTAASSSGTTPATATSTLVAVGNYVWVDLDRNGLQGESALRGVKVVLLTPRAKRARNAAGTVVPAATTDGRGRYVFDGLSPGAYRVRFVLPQGYRFTVPARPNARRNSNPIPSRSNPRVGTTPVFSVYGEVEGNTVRNGNPRVNAAFINPTIDAGVVLERAPFGPPPVTG